MLELDALEWTIVPSPTLSHVALPESWICPSLPKETRQLRRISNLRSDARASLVVDHRSDDWTELWWVRADLGFLGTEDYADGWRSRLANRYPQYREAGTVGSLLLFTIRSLSGWAAA